MHGCVMEVVNQNYLTVTENSIYAMCNHSRDMLLW